MLNLDFKTMQTLRDTKKQVNKTTDTLPQDFQSLELFQEMEMEMESWALFDPISSYFHVHHISLWKKLIILFSPKLR